jgi:membrane dipeptidase
VPDNGSAAGRPVIDCHSDLMIDVHRRRQAGERAVIASVHLPAFAEGGVVAAVVTVGGDCSSLCPLGMDEPYRSAIALLDDLHADVAESEGRAAVAVSPEEVEDCVERGVVALVPALEGAMPFEGDVDRVEEFHGRGVRVVGLTWNSRNELAVGLDSGEGGLSSAGERAVGRMNDLGMLVDLAHSAPATFWDVVQVTRAPVYDSHANAKAVYDHPRNLDEEQLGAISDSGGAVGVVFWPHFVTSGPSTVGDVVAHLTRLVEAVGPDSVVIGADFIDYGLDELAGDLRQHGSLYPDLPVYPTGLETVRGMQNLVEALPAAGLEDAVIGKVTVENFLRVWQATEAAA